MIEVGEGRDAVDGGGGGGALQSAGARISRGGDHGGVVRGYHVAELVRDANHRI